MFTRSKCPSAPVDWCRESLANGSARALVVNSGNANAFTGRLGREAVAKTATIAAQAAGCAENEVYIASTGCDRRAAARRAIRGRAGGLRGPRAGRRWAWAEAAKAIMTTDTFPKLATREAEIGGKRVRINGIAKGAGMIAPDMATMLAFRLHRRGPVSIGAQALLKGGADDSFNCVTVDGDTSTSDTLMLFATGKAGNAEIAEATDRRSRASRPPSTTC